VLEIFECLKESVQEEQLVENNPTADAPCHNASKFSLRLQADKRPGEQPVTPPQVSCGSIKYMQITSCLPDADTSA
jgi:hypothetical protein